MHAHAHANLLSAVRASGRYARRRAALACVRTARVMTAAPVRDELVPGRPAGFATVETRARPNDRSRERQRSAACGFLVLCGHVRAGAGRAKFPQQRQRQPSSYCHGPAGRSAGTHLSTCHVPSANSIRPGQKAITNHACCCLLLVSRLGTSVVTTC